MRSNIINYIWTLEAKASFVHKVYEAFIGLDDNIVKYCQNIGARPHTHMHPHTCKNMCMHASTHTYRTRRHRYRVMLLK